MPDISEFVQWAGGSAALVWAFRQGMEAFAALIKARAAKEQAEAAQDVAGAKALEDALERVDKLEARVAELEQQQAADAERCRQEIEQERARSRALAAELEDVRREIAGGFTGR